MTEQQAVNRFNLMNLLRIGATVVVLLALLLWQSDVFVEGGSIVGLPIALAALVVSSSIVGLPIALAALVVSFFGPKWLAARWRTPPGP
jgi:hypothetical protein